ncbi:MAG: aspartate aminotransferase family protein [Herpetosiphon sp.]
MNTQQLIADAERYFVPTYGSRTLVLDHGQGAEVWDSEGRRYLDFVAGIAVNALGHADPTTLAVLQEQAPRLIHTSNLFLTAPGIELARLLVETSFADKVFFCNSGTEAVEGAFKFARKVSYERHLPNKTAIVAFTGSFHGRTMGAVAATAREKYRMPFMPVMPGVRFAPFNDIAAAEAAIDADVCAVIVEPIQGEGGINEASAGFLHALRAACDRHGAMLIVDEIQAGMGRTGVLWAHEQSGIRPDILVAAKPLGGGLPIGTILITDAVAEYLHAGDHGSTFAGGPLVCAVALAVFRKLSDAQFLAHVNEIGDYLGQRLGDLQQVTGRVLNIRGRGLMRGVQVDGSAAAVKDAAQEGGLLLVTAGDDVLRFVPPLIIQREHVDEAVSILRHALEVLD